MESNDHIEFLTPEGKKEREEELEYLRTVRRAEVAEKIHIAKDGGDLAENAGYDAAKEEQAHLEGRIQELEALLAYVVIIEESSDHTVVEIGCHVTVAERGHSPEVFHVVGPAETDPGEGKISYESPLGKALMGKKPGEEVEVLAPDGPIRFRILEVR